MRIVSLLPAATDVVVALGHGAELVGVTHLCDPPGGDRTIVTTGGHGAADPHGPYPVDAAALAAVRPDVVLARSTCVSCPVPGAPVGRGCAMPAAVAVHAYDPTDLATVVEGVTRIGEAVGDVREGLALASHMRRRLGWLERSLSGVPLQPVTVVDPVGSRPGGGWVSDVVASARCSEAADGGPAAPATVLALDSGSRRARAGDAPRDASSAAGGEVYAVAAGSLSRPGPGLVDGAEALAWVFHRPHPDLRPAPGTVWRLADGGWADVGAATIG